MSIDDQVLYEYPFSERIRTLLRIEDLFDKLLFFCGQQHPYCHHTALLTLFEILEVTSRADLKSDLLQEWSDTSRRSMRFETTRRFPSQRWPAFSPTSIRHSRR